MKILDIVFKDLKRTFRSPFALIMMFGAPLLIAGLINFAFGGLSGSDGSFQLPRTRVVIANMDQADPSTTFKAGEMLVTFLQDESVAEILEVSLADREASARAAVDTQKADVALIIPANFTQAAHQPGQKAAVSLYQDPTLTIGPGIVKDLVNHFMDGFSGAKIAAQVTGSGLQKSGMQPDASTMEWATMEYAAFLNSSDHDAALRIISPSGEQTAEQPSAQAMIGPIMAGMLVFFVFYMGANGSESIIREHEEGTLARLFTTPTPPVLILGGKFVGVFLMLLIQAVLLLGASSLIFGISWGKPLSIVLVTVSLIMAATGFGVMLMSFIKSSRQTGPLFGGVLTLTAMVGGLFTNGIPDMPEIMDKVSLSMPQGWAMHAWKLSLAGGSAADVLLPVLVLAALGVVFFGVGYTLFRKRFL